MTGSDVSAAPQAALWRCEQPRKKNRAHAGSPVGCPPPPPPSTWSFGLDPYLHSSTATRRQAVPRPVSCCGSRRWRTATLTFPSAAPTARSGRCSATRQESPCWCVDAAGEELPGTRRAEGPPPSCLSFCQLHRQRVLLSGYLNGTRALHLPQCAQDGRYRPAQVDSSGQGWCVDADGMEVYGTRQRGAPLSCPSPCQVSVRRAVRASTPGSPPPQCDRDEQRVLATQCQLIGTAGRSTLSILDAFSMHPEAFRSLAEFRARLPGVHAYCYCADPQGRELPETGMELLPLGEEDDAAALTALAPSVQEAPVFRLLRRRFLALRLLLSGSFRCPTVCEVERSLADRLGGRGFAPVCSQDGSYVPTQCHGPTCWCVDTRGDEVFGSRVRDSVPNCGSSSSPCQLERQRALSHLFLGPSAPFIDDLISALPRDGSASFAESPSQEMQHELWLHWRALREQLLDGGLGEILSQASRLFPASGQGSRLLGDLMGGIFPTQELALTAAGANLQPGRIAEMLFGGGFLKNLKFFNFTGAVGGRGTFNFSKVFGQVGLTGMYDGANFEELARLFAPGEDSYLTRGSSNFSRESFNFDQSIDDSFARATNLERNRNVLGFVVTLLEDPRFYGLIRDIAPLIGLSGGDVGMNALTFLRVARKTDRRRTPRTPTTARGRRARSWRAAARTAAPTSRCKCRGAACWCVDVHGKEIAGTRAVGGAPPRCPSACEGERTRALLARRGRPVGTPLFVPECDGAGDYRPVQCSGDRCFCVGAGGAEVPGTGRPLGDPVTCPTSCQAAAAGELLQQLRHLGPVLQRRRTELTAAPLRPAVRRARRVASGAVRRRRPADPEFVDAWTKDEGDASKATLSDLRALLARARGAGGGERTAKLPEFLYDSGRQDLFPELSLYPSLRGPPEVLNFSGSFGRFLRNPEVVWKILTENASFVYTGDYAEFSGGYGDFESRLCWCVDAAGHEIDGTRTASPGQLPKCPGACHLAAADVSRYLQQADLLIGSAGASSAGEGIAFGRGLAFTEDELLGSPLGLGDVKGEVAAILAGGTGYAVRLAAQAAMHFHWRRRFFGLGTIGEGVFNGFDPYMPQCTEPGGWEPAQCDKSSGFCWCVDAAGEFVAGSLVARPRRRPQCATPCQRARAEALLTGWKSLGSVENGSSIEVLTKHTPACTPAGGQFEARQRDSESGLERRSWCVDPASGQQAEPLGRDDPSGDIRCPSLCELRRRQALLRDAGLGSVPECDSRGDYAARQCAEGTCWCASAGGEEIPGTRRHAGEPSVVCHEPRCQLPQDERRAGGWALVCEDGTTAGGLQRCSLACLRGFARTLDGAGHGGGAPQEFQCNATSGEWIGSSPQPDACQEIHPWQAVQLSISFTLRFPEEKVCNPEYEGLLESFNSFLLADLTARGFCHLANGAQVPASAPGGGSAAVAVCDVASVRVRCQDALRLLVNVTWRSSLSRLPVQSYPDLHNIERAFVAHAQRFAQLLDNRGYRLALNGRDYSSEGAARFRKDELYDTSPAFRMACEPGYVRIAQGCAACLRGSLWRDGVCAPCPADHYQDEPGQTACTPCPADSGTLTAGAAAASQCRTPCEREALRRGQLGAGERVELYCDPEGLYEGEKPTKGGHDEVRRMFEEVPSEDLVLGAVDAVALRIRTETGPVQEVEPRCLQECLKEERCDFLVFSTQGDVSSCHFYNGSRESYQCETAPEAPGFLGDPDSSWVERLSCRPRVSLSPGSVFTVYRKKGHELPLWDGQLYRPTGFGNAASGAYRTLALPAGTTTLPDAHLYCRSACSAQACCDGFLLKELPLDNGDDRDCVIAVSPFMLRVEREAPGDRIGGLSSPSAVTIAPRQHALINSAKKRQSGWPRTADEYGDGECSGLRVHKPSRTFGFSLGGVHYNATFKDLGAYEKDAGLPRVAARPSSGPLEAGFTLDLQRGGALFSQIYLWAADVSGRFSTLRPEEVTLQPEMRVAQQNFWLFRRAFSPAAGHLVSPSSLDASAGCRGDALCKAAVVGDGPAGWLECLLYPDTQSCGTSQQLLERPARVPSCASLLPRLDGTLYRKRAVHGPGPARSAPASRRVVTSPNPRASRSAPYGSHSAERSTFEGTADVILPSLNRSEWQIYGCGKKRDGAEGPVRRLYRRTAFRSEIGVLLRSVANLTGMALFDGFSRCERTCDEDPCCEGFAFLRSSLSSGEALLQCATHTGPGVQLCGRESPVGATFGCPPPGVDTASSLFGWYRAQARSSPQTAQLCPAVSLPPAPTKGAADGFHCLDVSTAAVDPTISAFDVVVLLGPGAGGSPRAAPPSDEWCLAACQQSPWCASVGVRHLEDRTRCVLHAETLACSHGARGGRHCRLGVLEPPARLYRKKGGGQGPMRPTVPLGSGQLQGTSRTVEVDSQVKVVDVFLGVPYAAPPLDANRFSGPQPPRPLAVNETWDADRYMPDCLQPDGQRGTSLSEDCLYLNIFVPKVKPHNASVLVFFPGGDNSFGGSAQGPLDPSYLAALGDIIVVTANYRLGLFGFLSTGDEAAAGNWGLLDQQAALRWVRDHAALFGGSAGAVTVAGDRSSADNVGLHLVAPGSRGLFQRAILMGGSVLSPSAVQLDSAAARSQAASLAQLVGCGHSSSEYLVRCLRGRSALALNAAQAQLLSGEYLQRWAAVVDGHFLRDIPAEAAARGALADVDIVLGATEDDGALGRSRLPQVFPRFTTMSYSSAGFDVALQKVLRGAGDSSFARDAVRWFYKRGDGADPPPLAADESWLLSNVSRDYDVVCPAVHMAEMWASRGKANAFLYYVPTPQSWNTLEWEPHSDTQLAFGVPLHPERKGRFCVAEQQLSRHFIGYLANFVKSGDPSFPNRHARGAGSRLLPAWPRFSLNEAGGFYKEVRAGMRNHRGLKMRECSFWKDYVQPLMAATGGIGEVERQWREDYHAWRQEALLEWRVQMSNFRAAVTGSMATERPAAAPYV
ncbi:LOW QUALITY PROTEIN: thyroglobulin [Lethenteron reissneri]|uniref:LOW QUALITY PROTEIN: thyroglobulin n=1 Tax=Lethenteron reissneri TaxID=7753 RepID=UPI002AB5F0B3|nr:LOW QUALITY PROTEIN: thyroglobulin [Lethenteron reissneri]